MVPFPWESTRETGVEGWFPFSPLSPHQGLGKLQEKEPADPGTVTSGRLMGFFSCPQSSGCLALDDGSSTASFQG